MNITRNNYEEYFVLYIDNELNATERATVESFLSENPDLKTELDMLQQAILPMDEPVSFFNKEILFRSESKEEAAAAAGSAKNTDPAINETNCEEYFVMYGDNELSNNDNALVEEFIYRHPQYQEHFELIQQVKYQPEKNIVFPDKSLLYRSERDNKVVPLFPRMRAWKMAAAAAVMLMIGGAAWYALKTGANDGVSGAVANTSDVPAAVKPGLSNSDTQPNNGSSDTRSVEPANSVARNNTDGTIEKNNNDKPANNIKRAGVNEDIKQTENLAAVESPRRNKNQVSPGKQHSIKPATAQPDNSSNKSFAEAAPKKVLKPGNISEGSTVPQERNNVKIENEKARVPVAEKKITNDESLASVDHTRTAPDTKVAIGPVELPENNVFAKLANDNDEEFETSDKKNRARGFFRKVSRVFDKATSKEPSENRKGLHIASFAINLK